MQFVEEEFDKSGSKENLFNKTIRLRMMSPCFKAATLVRARLCLKLRYPFRNLRQGALDDPEKDYPLWGMGRVVDTLYEACEELINDPSKLSSSSFTIFKGFPFLDEFQRKERQKSRSKREMWDEEARQEVYESTTEDDQDATHLQELMSELVMIHAKGVIDGLDRNCRDWLTRYDGKRCAANWTAKMKEDSKRYRKENISLCESVFALFDLVYRMSSRFRVDTADGVVRAMMSNLFDDESVADLWTSRDKGVLMSFASKNRDLFKSEHNEQAKAQEAHKAKAREEKQELARQKLMEEVEKSVSVFYLPRIKTKEELNAALDKRRHLEPKKRILSKQLKIYVNGFGLRQHDVTFTKGGKFQYAVVKSKLEEILDEVNAVPPKLELPNEPTSVQAQSVVDKYESLGCRVVKDYKNMLEKKVKEAFPDLLSRLNDLTRRYAPQLEVAWDQLKEIVWPRELTPEEKRLTRGIKIRFSETRGRKTWFEVHTILGMIWDDALQEYFVLLWQEGEEEPKNLKDCDVNAYLGDVYLENGEQFKVSLFKFDNFEILDA